LRTVDACFIKFDMPTLGMILRRTVKALEQEPVIVGKTAVGVESVHAKHNYYALWDQVLHGLWQFDRLTTTWMGSWTSCTKSPRSRNATRRPRTTGCGSRSWRGNNQRQRTDVTAASVFDLSPASI
jgi:hypothetical protein